MNQCSPGPCMLVVVWAGRGAIVDAIVYQTCRHRSKHIRNLKSACASSCGNTARRRSSACGLRCILPPPGRARRDIFLFEVIDGFSGDAVDPDGKLFEFGYGSTPAFPLAPGTSLRMILTNPTEPEEAARHGWKGFQCERRGHKWLPEDIKAPPRVCPKCKGPYWDRPRKDGRGKAQHLIHKPIFPAQVIVVILILPVKRQHY